MAESNACPIASPPPIKTSIASSVIAVAVKNLSDIAIASTKHVAGAFVVRALSTNSDTSDEHLWPQ